MIQLLPLSDNALFLANTRERLRAPFVISALVITAIIVTLIITNAYINPAYVYTNHSQYTQENRRIIPPPQKIFWDLAVGQGILLLVFGTLAAHRMAARERTTGTIEFHRSSPTPKIDQIIGLLTGAPCLEWLLFGTTLVVSIFFSMAAGFKAAVIIKFYISLILCAFFYHLCAILLGIMQYNIKNPLASRLGNWSFWIVLWLVFSSISSVAWSNISFFYHLTWMPAYDAINNLIFYPHPPWSMRSETIMKILNSFFGISMPAVVAQAFFQLPLIAFVWTAVNRKISRPEHPALSQAQSILLALFILLSFTGSSFSALVSYSSPYAHAYTNPQEMVIAIFIFLCLGLSVMGILHLTPTKDMFLKGLHKTIREGSKPSPFSDSHHSIAPWLGALTGSMAVNLFIFSYILPVGATSISLGFAVLLGHIFFFGGAMELFRLKYPRQKQSVFWTILAVLWVFLPIFGMIFDKIIKSKYILAYFTVFSPMTGVGHAVKAIAGDPNWYRHGYNAQLHQFELMLSLIVNLSLAVILQLLAFKQRRRLADEVARP